MHRLKFLQNRKNIQWGLPLLILLFADRASKVFAFQKQPHDISLVGKFLKLDFVKNTNLAFGVSWPGVMAMIVMLVVLCVLIFMLRETLRAKNYRSGFFLALILIGAVSNIVDRLMYGGVIDFLALPYWPIFNLADVYITVGIVGCVIREWRQKSKTSPTV